MVLDTICTLPLPADLFAQILHTTLPILSVGLSSGHVHTYRLPSIEDDEVQDTDSSPEPPNKRAKTTNGNNNGIISTRRRSSTASENGLGSIDTAWKTKRHKGSCRALTFSHDGEIVYSAGTDGIVKAALTETGRVVSKIAVPRLTTGEVDAPTVLHALSPMNLLLGTDSGRLYVHDMRQGGKEVVAKAGNVFKPHETEGDFVSSITPLPASDASTSGFPKQWISTGGTTVAVTDLRKGVLKKSDDQEDELTCSTFVGGLKKGKTSVGEKALVGQGSGVIGLWERGVWDDIDERIVVDRAGNSVECMTELPKAMGGVKMSMNEKVVAVGLDDGRVRFVKLGPNKVLEELDVKHDEVDGVVALDFDVAGRMVSGGGQIVKVWTEAKGMPGGFRSGEPVNGKGSQDSDDSDMDVDGDSSDEEVSEKHKRKKRKRNKGKDKSGGRVINIKGLS